jgi:DNA-binding PadR family transcriptional regulator
MHGHRFHRRRHRHRHDMGFFGWGRRFFGPGEVRIALLSLLEDGPRHGYDLMKELEARSGGLYRPSAGTIYPTLQQLEDEGLVAAQEVEGKRVYRITDKGREELAHESGTARGIWRRAEEWGGWSGATTPEAWELVAPATRLVKAALRAVSEQRGDPALVARVRATLERAAAEIEALADGD